MCRSKISIALLMLSAFVFGCASISPNGYNSFTQADAYRKDIYLSQHSDLPDKIKENILNGKVEIGMTEDEVEAAIGFPGEIRNRNFTVENSKEDFLLIAWYYYSYDWLFEMPKMSVFFKDGKVIGFNMDEALEYVISESIQDPKINKIKISTEIKSVRIDSVTE